MTRGAGLVRLLERVGIAPSLRVSSPPAFPYGGVVALCRAFSLFGADVVENASV